MSASGRVQRPASSITMVPFRSSSHTPHRGRRSLEHHSEPYEWDDERDRHIMTATFPIHPLPAMQAPFEESMLDATGETGHVPFPPPKKGVKSRQHMLCREASATELQYNFTYNCHWRNNPKGKFHPLTKTAAQIVFGVHLLHQHLEKSVADVADILLKHVNELDSFLQRANEDLEASLKDMLFRHKCLRVPMEHVNEFDRLLEDRAYRTQLLDGNIVIERTVGRMSELLNDYLTDINVFQEANRDLDMYLLNLGDRWTYRNEDIGRIYSAMCGNTGGWSQFLQSLVAKAERLGVVLVQVSSYCNEIEKRCGAASRRSLIATRTSSRNSSNSRENAHGRNFRQFQNNKPLPTPPSERSNYLQSATPGSASPASVDTQRRHSLAKPRSQKQLHNSNSTSRLAPKRSQDSGLTIAALGASPNLPQQPNNNRHDFYQQGWHNEDSRGCEQTQQDSRRIGRQPGHHRNASPEEKIVLFDDIGHNRTASSEEKIPVPETPKTKGQLSPSLTGKDSAYSSVSGASAMSPTGRSTRSTSAVSSPQAQFALFPSRNLTTPKASTPSRLGAVSPAFNDTSKSPNRADMSARAPSAMSNFPDAPNKRLSKRSSFMSFKRFFSKKHSSGGIDAIAE